MAARRGLGITSKDMEASRLVFCFVKDSKPKRKVAIPVPDSYTWEQFLDQVKAKLKLAGVAEIYFSSNGQKVRNVSELQDIDELCVIEGPDAVANGGAASAIQRTTAELPLESAATEVVLSPTMRQQSISQDRHRIVVSADGMLPARSGSYAADEEDHKYARRAHPLKRTLQRLFPGMFAPGLPVTLRDAQDSSEGSSSRPAGRRRRRRSPYDVRNLLLVLATMSCVFTMLYLFLRVSSSPGMGGPGAAQQAAHEVTEVGQAAAAVTTDAAAAAAGAVKAAAGGVAAAAGGAAAPGAPVLGGDSGAHAAALGGGGVP